MGAAPVVVEPLFEEEAPEAGALGSSEGLGLLNKQAGIVCVYVSRSVWGGG